MLYYVSTYWYSLKIKNKNKSLSSSLTYSSRFNYLNLSNQTSLHFENLLKVILSKSPRTR